MRDPIGIIASDLTGGMDTAVVFAGSTHDTTVLLGAEHEAITHNTVLVTDSAALAPGEAYARARRAAAHLAGRQLFKKIDSTLRGNVGPELRAVLDELAPAKAIICPALPREGRTVKEGVALLNGVPAHLTAYGSHPVTPCRESSVRALVQHSGIESRVVSLDHVRQGSDHLRRVIESGHSETVVVDAETEDDLRAIAGAFPLGDQRWVACGSSGLAAALALEGGGQPGRLRCTAVTAGHTTVAIIGSRNPTTVAQVAAVPGDDGFVVARIDAATLLAGGHGEQPDTWANLAGYSVSHGRSIILTTSLTPLIHEKRAEVAFRLGELARLAAERATIDTFVLSGGATAWSVCQSLGVHALAVRGEVEPGIAAADALDGTYCGTVFVTKAGGFGDAQTLSRMLGRLSQGTHR